MTKLPNTVVAIDVETTGLHSKDRIITFGGIRLDVNSIVNGIVKLDWLYFIADPGKKSHPKAEEVHGYNDWVLRHQDPFSENANIAEEFISSGDILIAHNANFDCEFVDREYHILGRPAPKYKSYCTMNAYRESGLPGRASLSAICKQIGLARADQRHGALEDAWLAMMVYFRLNGLSNCITSYERIVQQGLPSAPTNFIKAPPMPSGPLPRRSRKPTKSIEGKYIEDRAEDEDVSIELTPTISEQKAKLMAAVKPTATLLLEVARADYLLRREEIDILVSVVREIRDRKNIHIENRIEIDVIADLLEINSSSDILIESAKAVYADRFLREAFPRWLANIAAADGTLSSHEREGVDRVKAAISAALNAS
jgi:DNA polymerase-3 subunit epsilon